MNQRLAVFRRRPIFATLSLLAIASASSSAVGAPDAAATDDPVISGQAYLDEWNAKGAAACQSKDPACQKLGELLFNAAQAFQGSGERNKAIAARSTLIDPRYHLESTEIGKKALFLLAADYQSITEYARAADLYETAAKKFPAESAAPDALVSATIFRLALGAFDQAQKNAEHFDKVFGGKQPAMSITMWMGVAATLIEREKFKEAEAILAKVVSRVDRDGELRDKFISRALFASALAKLDDIEGAKREYGVVRAMWRNAGLQRKLLADGETNPHHLGKVLNVVGEAIFFLAEQKRQAVDAIRYPVYKGAADKDQIRKHINTKVVDWVRKKRPAIEEAEREYRQVLELQPSPPPRWVVASAARVGTMWAKFVAEFRAAPIPAEWKKNGPVPGVKDLTYQELRRGYYAAIDDAVEPQKLQAKAALKLCVDYSIKFQSFDEYGRSCQKWLERNYRTEFVHVDEFVPVPRASFVSVGPAAIVREEEPSK